MVYQKSDLPRRVKLGKNRYRIKTDFKDWIKFSSVLLDEEINTNVKSYVLVDLIFIDEVKSMDDYQRAITALFSFYRLYKQDRKIKGGSNEIAYDFREDWNLIYSSFVEQYHIDLHITDMHWFEFKALFDSLNKDSGFMKVVGYRTADLTKIKDNEMRREYAELKTYYSLTNTKEKHSQKSAKEREAELIVNAQEGGK